MLSHDPMTMTTPATLPNSVRARLNPNRTRFLYRFVRLHKVEDALRVGYFAHPETFIGSPYQFDSMLVEWLCDCKDPYEKD